MNFTVQESFEIHVNKKRFFFRRSSDGGDKFNFKCTINPPKLVP